MGYVIVGRVRDAGAVPIDRTTALGNPFSIQEIMNKRNVTSVKAREIVCDEYETYFHDVLLHREEAKQYLDKIIETVKRDGKVVLGCHCTPRRCHGITIKNYLEEILPEILYA